MQKKRVTLGPAAEPERITPNAVGNCVDVDGRPLTLNTQCEMFVQAVFYAPPECPRETGNAAHATPVRTKIGDACAKEDERPHSPLALSEMQYVVSQIFVALKAKHLHAGASACGLNQSVGVIVAPCEFEAAAAADQVARAKPVVHPISHVDVFEVGSREIQSTVELPTDEGGNFDAPLAPCRRWCHDGPNNCCQQEARFHFRPFFRTLIPNTDSGSVCGSQKL